MHVALERVRRKIAPLRTRLLLRNPCPQGISVRSEAIYRLYVFVLFFIEKALDFIIVTQVATHL